MIREPCDSGVPCQCEDVTPTHIPNFRGCQYYADFGSCQASHSNRQFMEFHCAETCGYCLGLDGAWAAWRDWEPCARDGASGCSSKRVRYCLEPAPMGTGEDCPGEGAETRECQPSVIMGEPLFEIAIILHTSLYRPFVT